MKHRKFYTFRRKILTGMLLVATIPMLIGYIMMLQVFNLSYRKNFIEEAESTLSATEEALDSAFLHIYKGMDTLCSSVTIQNYFGIQQEEYSYLAFRQLYAVNSQCGSYANFTLYDKSGNRKNSVAINKYIKDRLPLDWGVLYEAARSIGVCIVRNARIYHPKEEYLRVARAITNQEGEILGYAVATILKENFNEMLKGIGMEKQGVIYAVDDFYETVYCSAQSYEENELRAVRNHMMNLEAEEKTGIKSYSSMNGLYSYYELFVGDCRLHIYYQQPIASLNSMKNNLVTIAMVSGMVTLMFCLGLSGYFSNYIYRPVKRIQKAMKEIKKGNYQVKVDVDSQDELGELANQFNHMSEALDDNMTQLVVRERELSEAQIKMMQAQLNPHFLYNTLDTMKWIGKANHLPEVVTLSAGLAQILRMSISAGQMIHLSEELSLVEAYVEIQKIRFSDKFDYLVDVAEHLRESMVPKLMLQPMVENSILHGFEDRDHGMVMIQGYETGEHHLKLIVKDDGKGISPDKLNQIKEKSGIGIHNVDAMIQLRYGQQYGVTVESEEGIGTTVSILLPILKEENAYV